eukprot:8001665-Pyramimonas_sp.AAC.1
MMLTTDTCARATCAAAATALITSCAGIFSRRTNQTREARAYSHDGPIRRGKRGHILTTETNQTQEARVYSPDGPMGITHLLELGLERRVCVEAVEAEVGEHSGHTHRRR